MGGWGQDRQADEGPEVHLFVVRHELCVVDGLQNRRGQDHGAQALALLERTEFEAALDADAHPGGLGDYLPGPAPWALDGHIGVLDRI